MAVARSVTRREQEDVRMLLIPGPFYRELEEHAKARGVSVQEFLSEAVRREIETPSEAEPQPSGADFGFVPTVGTPKVRRRLKAQE